MFLRYVGAHVPGYTASFCRHQNFCGRDYSGSVNLNGERGCRRIAVPLCPSMTSALGGGWRLAPRCGRYTCRKESQYPSCRRLAGSRG